MVRYVGLETTGHEQPRTASAELDRRMMRLALRAARRGRPSPNPHVGAVIARASEVIAVAHHARVGQAHAEVAALRDAGARARGATLYVTLEPCNHHGRTGPCTDAIIAAGVARVVVGCHDPAPHVPGAIARLRSAGIDVTVPVLETEAMRAIDDFAKHITTGMPFVTLLGAQLAASPGTGSGFAAATGSLPRARLRRLRLESDAVLVGVDFVLAGDPELVRCDPGRGPLRALLDPRLRLPATSRMARTAADNATVVFHARAAPRSRVRELQACGLELVEVPDAGQGVDCGAVLRELGRRDIVRLLVEDGAHIAQALLQGGLVDRVILTLTPPLAAGVDGTQRGSPTGELG